MLFFHGRIIAKTPVIAKHLFVSRVFVNRESVFCVQKVRLVHADFFLLLGEVEVFVLELADVVVFFDEIPDNVDQ